MNDNGHSKIVRNSKYTTKLFHMLGIVIVDSGISEMKLYPPAKFRRPGATCDFIHCVILQWIDSAEANQSVWKFRNFPRGPIVVRSHLFVIVRNVARRLGKDVGRRKNDGTRDACGVEYAIRSFAATVVACDTGGVDDVRAINAGLNRCW
jgi:hypothetical protein